MNLWRRIPVAICALLLVAAVPDGAPLPEQEGDAVPAETVQRAVLAASYAYFAAKDSGDYATAYKSIDADMRSYLTPELFRDQAARFNAGAGKALERRVVKLTWERDPPEARRPGLYVAADFVSRFSNTLFHCGYLMWRQQDDGSFRIVREEQNFLDADTAKQMPPEQIKAMPRNLGCVVS